MDKILQIWKNDHHLPISTPILRWYFFDSWKIAASWSTFVALMFQGLTSIFVDSLHTIQLLNPQVGASVYKPLLWVKVKVDLLHIDRWSEKPKTGTQSPPMFAPFVHPSVGLHEEVRATTRQSFRPHPTSGWRPTPGTMRNPRWNPVGLFMLVLCLFAVRLVHIGSVWCQQQPPEVEKQNTHHEVLKLGHHSTRIKPPPPPPSRSKLGRPQALDKVAFLCASLAFSWQVGYPECVEDINCKQQWHSQNDISIFDIAQVHSCQTKSFSQKAPIQWYTVKHVKSPNYRSWSQNMPDSIRTSFRFWLWMGHSKPPLFQVMKNIRPMLHQHWSTSTYAHRKWIQHDMIQSLFQPVFHLWQRTHPQNNHFLKQNFCPRCKMCPGPTTRPSRLTPGSALKNVRIFVVCWFKLQLRVFFVKNNTIFIQISDSCYFVWEMYHFYKVIYTWFKFRWFMMVWYLGRCSVMLFCKDPLTQNSIISSRQSREQCLGGKMGKYVHHGATIPLIIPGIKYWYKFSKHPPRSPKNCHLPRFSHRLLVKSFRRAANRLQGGMFRIGTWRGGNRLTKNYLRVCLRVQISNWISAMFLFVLNAC